MSQIGKLFFLLISIFLTMPGPAGAAETGRSINETADYRVEIVTTLNHGKRVAAIRVKGRSDYHCNTLYKWQLKVSKQAGVTLEKELLKKEDARKFTEDEVVFKVGYRAKTDQKITAELKFSVCNEKQCLIEKITLKW